MSGSDPTNVQEFTMTVQQPSLESPDSCRASAKFVDSNASSTFGPTAEYQMPLFSRYPLWVEFDRKRQLIEQVLTCQFRAPESAIDDQLSHLMCVAEISPLVILTDQISFSSVVTGKRKGSRQREYCVTARIPYFGDDELWDLHPGHAPMNDPMPQGELFRRELILVEQFTTLDVGHRRIQDTIQWIQSTINAQTIQIQHYQDGLIVYLEGMVARGTRSVN